jgi:hypothetical protein
VSNRIVGDVQASIRFEIGYVRKLVAGSLRLHRLATKVSLRARECVQRD